MMQRAALAVAKHLGEFDDAALAGGQELLAGEFRRGAQIKPRRRAVRRHERGGEGMQMGLVARGNLQGAGLDLDEIPRRKPGAQRRHDAAARQQCRPPVGVDVASPEGRGGGRGFRHVLVRGEAEEICGDRAQDRYGAPLIQRQNVEVTVKVIASSLRKGNIVEVDGKLGVIVSVENIHPGKGTPVTQMDVRRIADGVKVALRYKTTDQVERAFVEDRKHQYMYQDGDGFHFMNMESYDQVALPADIVGDQAAYLQPEMEVTISLHEGVPVAIELPPRATLEVTETEPTIKSQTAASSYKPALLSNGVRTMVPSFVTAGTRIVVNTSDGSYIERAKE